jgi:hypothetical protein
MFIHLLIAAFTVAVTLVTLPVTGFISLTLGSCLLELLMFATPQSKRKPQGNCG